MTENREKKSTSFPAVTGASSLLVIFSVLCLTVFAMLSLSTSTANHRIVERNTQALKEYYQAEAEANGILAQLRDGIVPAGVSVSQGELSPGLEVPVFEYSCRISDTRTLTVRVWVNTEEQNGEYRLLRWQETTTFDWQPDTHIPVYTGN